MCVRISRSDSAPIVVATLDDRKANVITSPVVAELHGALDDLSVDEALVITGRAGVFSGGLDLAVLGEGGEAAESLSAAMGRLLLAVLESPRPVVVAADGHGVAAGAMLMLAADIAIVSDRPASYGFAEVRRGIALPRAVVELIAARTTPAAVLRLAAHGELVGPQQAVAIGLADEIVASSSLLDTALERAAALAALPADAYATTKRRVVGDLAAAMRSASST